MKVYKVKVNGKVYEVELESVTESSGTISAPLSSAASLPAQGQEVVSPMAGTIVAVNVQVGDTVSKGQCLAVLEAMKLENEIVSPCDGKVKQVLVNKGTAVSNKQLLVVIG